MREVAHDLATLLGMLQFKKGLTSQEMAAVIATASAAWAIEQVDNGVVGTGQMIAAGTEVIVHYRRVLRELAEGAVAERACPAALPFEGNRPIG